MDPMRLPITSTRSDFGLAAGETLPKKLSHPTRHERARDRVCCLPLNHGLVSMPEQFFTGLIHWLGALPGSGRRDLFDRPCRSESHQESDRVP